MNRVARDETTTEARPRRAPVVLALGALYLIWGSTYLAIRIALEGIPPLMVAGGRFLVAGALLLAVLRLRGAPWPSLAAWRAGAIVGILLCGSNALVTVAEQWVSSSLAAIVIASVPLWTVAAAALLGEPPRRGEVIGLGVGLGGVVVLNAGGGLRAAPAGAALLVLATWCWAVGSTWSRRLPLAPGLLAAATEMIAGGALLVVLAVLRGERVGAVPAARPMLAWIFLTAFGSVVAFSAYNFLLRAVRPALATSYAYVNPAVAVLLGAAVGEAIGARALGALGLILAGVAILAGTRASGAERPAPSGSLQRGEPRAHGDAP